MMEDIWVQRSLLDAVKAVNDQMGAFERVKYADAGGKVIDDPESKTGPHDPLRRKFQSRTWEVSIEVGKQRNPAVPEGHAGEHDRSPAGAGHRQDDDSQGLARGEPRPGRQHQDRRGRPAGRRGDRAGSSSRSAASSCPAGAA